MTREFPERNPEWLTDNDWSAESRLKWIKTLNTKDTKSWMYGFNNRNFENFKFYAIYCLFTFDNKKDCEICWECYVQQFEWNNPNPRRNKPKDLDVVLEMLNNNKSISEIAQHFNVKELTVKRWIKEIKLGM